MFRTRPTAKHIQVRHKSRTTRAMIDPVRRWQMRSIGCSTLRRFNILGYQLFVAAMFRQ
jgi:hypothetical protein